MTWIEKSEPREPDDDRPSPSRGSLTKRLTSADHARVASLLRGAIANLDAAAALVLSAYGASDRASRTFDQGRAMRRGLANLVVTMDDRWRKEQHGGASPYEEP